MASAHARSIVNGDRVGSSQLRSVELRLTDRDRAILQSLSEHRFLTTSQIQRLHFAGHATALAGIRGCVRVLGRLRTLRAVTRLERRIGGLHAGSRAFVWCLDAVGERLVRRPDRDQSSRRRVFEPTILFLEHTLAVAELRVALEEAAREGRVGLEQVQTEPASWRDYVGPHGERAVLKPDLAFVTTSGDYEDHYFAEIDRGTESVRTLLAKCEQYERYRASGREQAATGVFPLVVWVMPDATRRDRLVSEIEAARTLDQRLYRVVTGREALPMLAAEPPPLEVVLIPAATPTNERRNP